MCGNLELIRVLVCFISFFVCFGFVVVFVCIWFFGGVYLVNFCYCFYCYILFVGFNVGIF